MLPLKTERRTSVASSVPLTHESEESAAAELERVRAIFVGQPIFRDLHGLRTAFFSVTDFLQPIPSSLVEDMASCLVRKISFRDADVLVSIADRTSGPLAHAVARLVDLPYTLANWYPKGSPGEIEIEACAGFSGEGLIFLNGIRSRHRKAIIVMDVLKTGATAANLVRALERSGVTVVHCAFACEIVEARGRELDTLVDIPISSLVRVFMRGECTKEAKTGHHTSVSKPPQSPRTRIAPPSNMSFGALQAHSAASEAASYTALSARQELSSAIRLIKKMSADTLRQKIDRVSSTFVHVPIHNNPHLSYPYSFFTLTDFIPAMAASLVEDMADLCVYFGDFERCDVLVSEADRGGGPLTQAVAARTLKPYVLANWYASGEGLGAASKVQVGFSGQGNIVVNGIRSGWRCTFVDDMLSSGGTAEGVIRSILALGGIPVEAVFVSEKLYPREGSTIASEGTAPTGSQLPQRKGKKRLSGLWPHLDVTTVVQFIASGERTTAPVAPVA